MTLGTCKQCKKEAVISKDFKIPLCSQHYVEMESDEALSMYIESSVGEDTEIKKEIKKQKKHLYEAYKDIF